MIVAKNIHKFYENKHILKGIDIKIEEGEIVSLIGSSGAGKTTLLQILSTIEKYEAGYNSILSLNGINLDSLNKNEIAKLRNENLGFVFQFHELLDLYRQRCPLNSLPSDDLRCSALNEQVPYQG